ncbi:MAG: 16S rRNA (cytidine(1402)-2'-O)-methyltransferase [Pyrinomonadaceae bacterium]
MRGSLVLISTPIGNLGDISERAIETLRSVDIVACEDTRHTGKLLKLLGLSKKLLSLHEHNETARIEKLLGLISEGKTVGLVSDAGTPLISDPGFDLVGAVRDAGFSVTAIPGPAALISALVISGLPTDSFYFGGFLPSKSGARKKAFENLENLEATLVFYESPKRIAASVKDAHAVFGARKAAVARELTKLHEEVLAGTLAELETTLSESAPKGEIVFLIDRTPANKPLSSERDLAKLVKQYEADGLKPMAALKKAARECGFSKSEAYRLLQQSRD